MSRLSKIITKLNETQKLKPDEIVTNFMGGDSYKLNPLETLKMIAASSIFGEASYYRESKIEDGIFKADKEIINDLLLTEYEDMSTTEIFTKAIDSALDFDFEGTLQLAVNLRNDYYMRLNPQVIMVRASMHDKRKEWSDKNPGRFNQYQANIMLRADEPATQAAYYIYVNNGKKANMPSILKRSIAAKLNKLTPYEVNKYKNAEIGMINTVRLVHANSPVLDELMQTGTVIVPATEQTWEQKRSAGMNWSDILATTKMGHMALLRNIRNVFTEINDLTICEAYMEDIKDGVLKGKQFPFRYESAYRTIQKCDNINHKQYILDKLEECIDISVNNLPKLKGRTMCLSDNSASAWDTFNSEYGTVTVANIDNLSSVIAAQCSDEGYVCKFGDRYVLLPISKRNGVLSQASNIDNNRYCDVGGSTEGGIWKFFREALNTKEWYDNIFIFSDMQAGVGGLYGTNADKDEYLKDFGFRNNVYAKTLKTYYNSNIGVNVRGHINVYKLILEYRKKVNPKVNVFCIQTGGYDNVLIPQMSYRCAMLTGWTGKEIQFAAEYIKQWDDIENKIS